MEEKAFNRLLKEIRQSEKAIEELYRFYYPRAIKHFVPRYGRELSEDAAQEFFVHLLEIGDAQEYIHNPTGWVYACIENVIKRKLQLGSRYRYEEEAAAHGTLDGVEDEIYADQLLKDLDPLEKKIIYYIHWEGYTR